MPTDTCDTCLHCLFGICRFRVTIQKLAAPGLVDKITPTSQGHQHDWASDQEEKFKPNPTCTPFTKLENFIEFENATTEESLQKNRGLVGTICRAIAGVLLTATNVPGRKMSVHIVMTCIETPSLRDFVDMSLACIASSWPCMEKNSPNLMFRYWSISLS